MAETLIYILFTLPSLAIITACIVLNVKGKWSGRLRADITAMLIVVSLSMFFYAQYYNVHLTSRYSWGFDFLYLLITPFCAPLYYLFIDCLTDIKRRPAVNVMVFFPSIIYSVLLVSAQSLMNSAERHAYICNEILGQNIQLEPSVAYSWMVMVGKKMFDVFMPIQAILVMTYGEIRLNRHIRILNDYNTYNMSGKTIKMREIHVLTVLIVVTGLIMSAIPKNGAVDHIWLVVIAVVGQIVMVSLIVRYILRLEISAEEMVQSVDMVPDNMDIMNGNLSMADLPRNERKLSLIEKIDNAMEIERLYLKPDLSLVSLCERVGTNRTYASKAIKEAKGCNFSDYVNRYRLEYALEMMKTTAKDKIIIQNLATQCGFGSIQTFYRYFKIFYNETPTQWIERNK
jgi:AraC-like DNA-binding protein